MVYTCKYESPIGNMLLASDEIGLTGLWFEGQKHFASTLTGEHIQRVTDVHRITRQWLDIYFSREEPQFTPPLNPQGTSFRENIWEILLSVPYGQTVTYGEIADAYAREKQIDKMSARTIGGAVGHNPILLIIPCHRVVGRDRKLTGYAGGIKKKTYLLNLESADLSN